MKCADCELIDFCQAGFWEHCDDWENNDDTKRHTIFSRFGTNIDRITATVTDKSNSTTERY